MAKLHVSFYVGLREKQTVTWMRVVPTNDFSLDPSLNNIRCHLCNSLRGKGARDFAYFRSARDGVVDPEGRILQGAH